MAAPETAPPTDPADLPAVFGRAFNTGDPAVLDALYEPDAVLAAEPGRPVTGDERRRTTAEFLALGVPIRLSPRRSYVCGDIALLVNDFAFHGDGPDGPVHLTGTATDVARRGADGRWRYVISNPPGTTDPDFPSP